MSKNIKSVEELKLPKEYELTEVKELKDSQSLGLYLRHKKTGARVVVISNDDDNKVFFIGFRTPHYNSTGVAHIVEHTVLCGSRKFPSKDPFVELVKGSLNTFLNAVTFPDKTLYPVASCNDKDFKNLMHVYLDAVFYPKLYENPAIFEQEGWHYELDPETDELILNGVVYNEMKGALSDPETIEGERINEALFPDNQYGYEYGGDPDHIPDLTYEDYLDFHRKHYHPSNAYIYLYGDLDIEERLAFLDKEYLSAFEKKEIDVNIPLQKPVSSDFTETYSIAESEEEKEKTFLSYSVVAGESGDFKLMTSLSLLQYVMLEAPGAPVKKALLDAKIGKDINGGYNTSIKQPCFEIHVSGAEASKKEAFKEIVERVYGEAAEKGIPEKMLSAAINYAEFKYREQDFGRYPKGLLKGVKMCDSWFYDDHAVFDLVDRGEIYDELRSEIGTGYFEGLIKKYFLRNPHKAILALVPEKGKNDRKEEELKKKLAKKRAEMTEADLLKLKESSEKLQAFQSTPSTKEELDAIPILEREDIGKASRGFKNEVEEIQGQPVIRHDIETNEIVYLRMNFDLSDMKKEDIPYFSLLSAVYTLVDTEHYDYNDLNSEILMNTGGLGSGFHIYSSVRDREEVKIFFSTELKVLASQLKKGLSLIPEVLYRSKIGVESDKRLQEILDENVMNMQLYFESNGNRTAVMRGLSRTSVSGIVGEEAKGLRFYRFIKDLSENFEEKKAVLYKKLHDLIEKYFVKERVLFSVTGTKEIYSKIEKDLEALTSGLPTGEKAEGERLSHVLSRELSKKKEERGESFIKEAYTASGQVQYVARSGNFKDAGLPYTGLLSILQVMLSYDYLWVNVRVKGGAYGCGGKFDRNGDASFSSYRDPKLLETNEVYEGIIRYLEEFTADEKTITKYIIGAISGIDMPLTPYAEGERSFAAYLMGMTDADVEKSRAEILGATEEEIKGLSRYVKAVLDARILTVVGSEAKIKENEKEFDTVESLLN